MTKFICYINTDSSLCDICHVVFSSKVPHGPSNDYGSVCYDCITEGFLIKGLETKPNSPKRCLVE